MVTIVMKCNGSWLWQFCCWCFNTTSEASKSFSGEQENKVDNTISIILSTLTGSMSTSEVWDGDSSSAITIDSISRKAPSSLLLVLQQAKTSDLSRRRII